MTRNRELIAELVALFRQHDGHLSREVLETAGFVEPWVLIHAGLIWRETHSRTYMPRGAVRQLLGKPQKRGGEVRHYQRKKTV